MPSHRNLKNPAMVVLALCLLVAMTVFSYWFAKRRSLDDMHRVLAPRAEFYAATIGGILNKYEFLPLALAQSAEVADLLQRQDPASVAQVNRYLEDINTRVGAFAVYVLDPQGLVLASSNWREPTSYVGQNYAFRPYFEQAIRGEIGRFYGIGVSTGEAGLFISQPIRRGGRIIGVAAAKVSLDWIEQSWRAPGATEQLWVTDSNGVVILSSIPSLKFTSLAPLSQAQRQAMQRQRQFLHEALPAVAHPVLETFADGAQVVSLSTPPNGRAVSGSNSEFLAVGRSLAPLEWRITVLSDLAQVRAVARNAALAALLAWAVVLLGILYARQRRRRIDERLAAQEALKRAYDELEIKVGQRTADLLDANQRLQAEVAERERAEQTLRHAQAELVQSGKLAAIGQMAAGVTHELNQPLAALQTFSDNARVLITRGRSDEALENLSIISDLVQRLGYITSQLKAFARRSDDAKRPAHVQKAYRADDVAAACKNRRRTGTAERRMAAAAADRIVQRDRAGAGIHQPAVERDGCDERLRHQADRNQHRANRRPAGNPPVRQRQRHPRAADREDFRPVLHHQGARPGAGAVDQRRDHPQRRRAAVGAQPACRRRRRRGIHHQADMRIRIRCRYREKRET